MSEQPEFYSVEFDLVVDSVMKGLEEHSTARLGRVLAEAEGLEKKDAWIAEMLRAYLRHRKEFSWSSPH